MELIASCSKQKTDLFPYKEAVLESEWLSFFMIKYSPDQETFAIDKTFFQQNQRFSIWDRIIIYILGVWVSLFQGGEQTVNQTSGDILFCKMVLDFSQCQTIRISCGTGSKMQIKRGKRADT